MENHKAKLKEITRTLLKKEDNYGEIKETCDALHQLFSTVAELNEDEVSREDCYLPKGKAIGSFWAGACVKEMMRTKRFICGVFYGIKKARKRFPDRPIHILYAGTGPFGTLMLPLTTVFTSNEIKFTLLEINHSSIESLKKVIQSFEAEEYVEEIVKCDATEYKAEKGKPIHMIVTETMQNALKKEPQVAITLNLVPQMEAGGILIPQNITVEAVLFDPKREMERTMGVGGADKDFYYPLKKIFELNKDNAQALGKKENYYFPEIEIELPQTIEERYKRLSLLTTIQVFEGEQLTYNQCSLNLPYKIMDIDCKKHSVKKISFQYVVSEKPGFIHKLQDLSISLELVESQYDDLLLKIFKESRPELSWISGITEEQKSNIINQQFTMERQQLIALYPEAELNIVMLCGKPIGRLYLYYGEKVDRILEIGLLEQYRGRGIGGKLVTTVIENAAKTGKTVRLQVAWFNQVAYAFYQRIGFKVIENHGVSFEMQYAP